jgi:hypothetical protein
MVAPAAVADPDIDMIVPTQVVLACTVGSPGAGPVCRQQNPQVSYYVSLPAFSASEEAGIDSTVHSQYGPRTDLSFTLTGWVTSGPDPTDLVYWRSGMASNFAAYTYCARGATGTTCDQIYVTANTNTNFFEPYACHETGHGVGEVHGNEAWRVNNPGVPIDNWDPLLGCLKQPVDQIVLSNTQINNIDWVY